MYVWACRDQLVDFHQMYCESFYNLQIAVYIIDQKVIDKICVHILIIWFIPCTKPTKWIKIISDFVFGEQGILWFFHYINDGTSEDSPGTSYSVRSLHQESVFNALTHKVQGNWHENSFAATASQQHFCALDPRTCIWGRLGNFLV